MSLLQLGVVGGAITTQFVKERKAQLRVDGGKLYAGDVEITNVINYEIRYGPEGGRIFIEAHLPNDIYATDCKAEIKRYGDEARAALRDAIKEQPKRSEIAKRVAIGLREAIDKLVAKPIAEAAVSGEDPMELTRAMCGGSRKRERP